MLHTDMHGGLVHQQILSNVLFPARGVVWGGDQHAMEFLAKCLTLGFAHVSCLFKSLFICKMLKKVMTLTVDIRDSIHKLHPGSLQQRKQLITCVHYSVI